jgi:hypothetical protein
MPRRPRYRCASTSTSASLSSVAQISASMAATASRTGYQHARSSAVRAGVVTFIPSITHTSSASSRSPLTLIIGARRRLWWMSSAGLALPTHFAPWTAAAENPATTPCRFDHSHPAFALLTGVSS